MPKAKIHMQKKENKKIGDGFTFPIFYAIADYFPAVVFSSVAAVVSSESVVAASVVSSVS